jgi:hypothetical protein
LLLIFQIGSPALGWAGLQLHSSYLCRPGTWDYRCAPLCLVCFWK